MSKPPSPLEIAWMKAHAADTRVPDMIAATVICSVASTAFVVLRFISRRMACIKPRLNDWLLVVSLVLYLGFAIGFACATLYGAGRHIILLKSQHRPIIRSINISDQVLYFVALAFVKFSILSLYVVIFPGRVMRWSAIVIGVIIAALTTATTLMAIFRCVPMSWIWDPTVTDPRCIQFSVLVLAHGISNIVTDLIIFAMPIHPILKLKMPKDKKVYVLLSFLLGASACIASIVRTAYTLDLDSTSDPTWDDMPVSMVSLGEIMAGILAACLPTYGPLVHYIRHKKKRSGDRPEYRSAVRITPDDSGELMMSKDDTYKGARNTEVSMMSKDDTYKGAHNTEVTMTN